ncbi:hypothetical protein [Alkalibacillus haloalkaliphilus]|uniref:hypothetical protein n=1 Tax=Alkalibacillus haloalkaliphilus TaxID=94136 RepID=UPI00293631F5|nr:hypothetical protein [Alkalibacillus haloalkaliphilus]MDV2582797.1 hypothetical protein [Alkalibacillus haloalkaliphilus]
MSEFNDKKLEKQLKSLPKHEMTDEQIESMHAELIKTAEQYDQKDKRRIFMRRIAVGVTTAAAVFLIAFIGISFMGDDDHADEPMTTQESDDFDGEASTFEDREEEGTAGDEESRSESQEEEARDESEEAETEEAEQDSESIVIEQSKNIIEHLANEDYSAVADFVHEEQGLLFSPYINVSEDDLIFTAEEVANFETDETVYVWGTEDGSGYDIELTPMEYHEEYIYQHDYTNPDERLVDEFEDRSMMENNIQEYFPEAHVVEYYVEGSDDMDYGSINLVYEENDAGEWKLVAIVNEEWVI